MVYLPWTDFKTFFVLVVSQYRFWEFQHQTAPTHSFRFLTKSLSFNLAYRFKALALNGLDAIFNTICQRSLSHSLQWKIMKSWKLHLINLCQVYSAKLKTAFSSFKYHVWFWTFQFDSIEFDRLCYIFLICFYFLSVYFFRIEYLKNRLKMCLKRTIGLLLLELFIFLSSKIYPFFDNLIFIIANLEKILVNKWKIQRTIDDSPSTLLLKKREIKLQTRAHLPFRNWLKLYQISVRFRFNYENHWRWKSLLVFVLFPCLIILNNQINN